ncbi:MAG: hypothetical protein L0Z54_01915 [Thermoplasmata archaeon]|nr:hypothetical protein [Thermoplasmata archaeon]
MAESYPPVVGLIIILSFILALGFGFLSWVARNHWRDLRQTRFFAYLGIVFTLIFMIMVMRYL